MYTQLKNDILGKQYSLSIAYVSEKKSREINKKYRGKDKATNVLSFPLRKNEGELVLCKAVIKKEALGRRPMGEAKNSNKIFKEWLGFLVIHGLLHLKGLEHGKRMEKLEKFYCKRF